MQPDDLALSSKVRFRAVADEGVVVHIERGEVAVVNPLGLRTLEFIRDTGSFAATVAGIVAEFDEGSDTVKADVERFVVELRELDILS